MTSRLPSLHVFSIVAACRRRLVLLGHAKRSIALPLRGLALIPFILVAGCDWQADAPLLGTADLATIDVQGRFERVGLDEPSVPVRFAPRSDRRYDMFVTEGGIERKEATIGFAHLGAATSNFYLVEVDEEHPGVEYLIGALMTDELFLYQPLCNGVAGVRVNSDSSCTFSTAENVKNEARIASDQIFRGKFLVMPIYAIKRLK